MVYICPFCVVKHLRSVNSDFPPARRRSDYAWNGPRLRALSVTEGDGIESRLQSRQTNSASLWDESSARSPAFRRGRGMILPVVHVGPRLESVWPAGRKNSGNSAMQCSWCTVRIVRLTCITECSLLDCETMWSCRWVPTFRRNILPPPSGFKYVGRGIDSVALIHPFWIVGWMNIEKLRSWISSDALKVENRINCWVQFRNVS
jgi:hypothetical protein